MAEPEIRGANALPPDSEASRLAVQLRPCLPSIRERYCLDSIAIFGSYVRNEQRVDSDLDLLVTFAETPSLFNLVGLRDELSQLLGVSVDVVMRSFLPHRIARWIDREAIAI